MNIEKQIKILKKIKESAGLHSPSTKEIIAGLGYNPIKHDFCFLSNPYATDIVVDHFKNFFSKKSNIFNALESYPADQSYVAKNIATFEDLNSDHIVVGNGAVQAIEWVCEGWGLKNLLIPTPTYSTYYELLNKKYTFTSDFWLSENLTADTLIKIANKNNCDSVLLINPNNPTSEAMSLAEIQRLVSLLGDKKLIIDESFSHFLENYSEYSNLRKKLIFKNVTFIKSMSKDCGVAGIRLGYLYTIDKNLLDYSKRKTTWNLNNFSVLFSDLLVTPFFNEKYNLARLNFFKARAEFLASLKKISGIKVYTSQANFFLIKYNGKKTPNLVYEMLLNDGIYVRTMSDKVGLDNDYIRVAVRRNEENNFFVNSLKKYIS